LTISGLAKRAGVSRDTISNAERGLHSLQASTLHKVAQALGKAPSELLAEEEKLSPTVESSSLELSFDGALDDERREAWEAAADKARRLRETGEAQMRKALAGWSASKERGEPYATRREYLDEMGDLLQEVYGAYVAVGEAYVEAAFTQGGDEASVPSYLKEESRVANDFYVELFSLVRSAGLSIRTGASAPAAKRAGEDQPEARSYNVEELEAA